MDSFLSILPINGAGTKELFVTILATAVAIFMALNIFNFFSASKTKTPVVGSSIFDFVVSSTAGEDVSLSTFRGKKAYLVVNVASK
jgi:hypothetical protein